VGGFVFVGPHVPVHVERRLGRAVSQASLDGLHIAPAVNQKRRQVVPQQFCDETLRKYIGTRNSNLAFPTRKRIALQFLYGLTTFTAKASCIAEDVGRVRPR
jgi:hypothetical protein